MATYLVEKEILIERKEGDVADIIFTVPEVIDMTGRTARFGVFRQGDEEVFIKEPTDITVDGQVITIPLAPDDTMDQVGVHVWELKVIDDDGPITIGKGDLKILKAWLT